MGLEERTAGWGCRKEVEVWLGGEWGPGSSPVEFGAMEGQPSGTKGPCPGGNIDLEIAYIATIAEFL